MQKIYNIEENRQSSNLIQFDSMSRQVYFNIVKWNDSV
jgi:hypothetical protein